MSISAISSSSYTSDLYQALLNQNTRSSQTSSTSSSTSSSSDYSDLSTDKQVFAKLHDLETSAPDKFKEVTADLAKQLESAANDSTDSGEKQFLTSLADKFKEASSTGHLDMPHGPGGAEGGQGSYGPPPPPPSSSSSDSSDSTSSDSSTTKLDFSSLFNPSTDSSMQEIWSSMLDTINNS